MYSVTSVKAKRVERLLKDTEFEMKQHRMPRVKRPSLRQQTLVGERPGTDVTKDEKVYYRAEIYFPALDNVTREMRRRFSDDDRVIFTALGDVVLNLKTKPASFAAVAKYYGLDQYLLQADKRQFITC